MDICGDVKRLWELIHVKGLTTQEAAEELHISEDDCLERLRLMALPDSMLMALEAAGLTRRHGLALLRVCDSRLRQAALVEMAYLHLPENEADRYIDAILPPRLPAPVHKFLAVLDRAIDELRADGISPELQRDDADNRIKLTLRIPI